MYDVCWIKAYGIPINGHIMDTMLMASLIDENRLWYTLNSISFDYLREVKDEKALKEAAESWGIDPNQSYINYLQCMLEVMQNKMQNLH